jgi:transposase
MSYDKKFRHRAIEYLNNGHTIRATAAVFNINPGTLVKWQKQLNKTGSLEPKKAVAKWHKIDDEKLLTYVKENPDAYYKEIAEAMGVCIAAIQKAFKRLKITRKKNDRLQRS